MSEEQVLQLEQQIALERCLIRSKIALARTIGSDEHGFALLIAPQYIQADVRDMASFPNDFDNSSEVSQWLA